MSELREAIDRKRREEAHDDGNDDYCYEVVVSVSDEEGVVITATGRSLSLVRAVDNARGNLIGKVRKAGLDIGS
jgi:hypothetical protein